MGTLTSTHTTFLCILTASLAGAGSGFFGCLLAYADKLKIENGNKNTRLSKCLTVTGMLGSTLFGCGSLVALYFGSLALVTVIRAGTLLPANAMFAHLFQLRPLVREDYLGTVVAISGVICFTIFTGTPGHNPSTSTFARLISSAASFAGNSVLLAFFLASLFWVCLGQYWIEFRHRSSGRIALAAAVACIGGCSSAFMDLATKGWTASLHAGGIHGAVTSPLFWSAFLVNAFFLVAMRTSMIYGCKRCDVLLFVPLNTVFNILISVGAGLVVMEEWRQVTSWVGLTSSGLCILGGISMLVCGPAEGQERPQRERTRSGDDEDRQTSSRDSTTPESSSEVSSAPCLERKGSMFVETGAVLYETAVGGCHTKSVALSRLNWVHKRAADARARLQAEFREFRSLRRHKTLENGRASAGSQEAGDAAASEEGRAGRAIAQL